MQEIVRKIVILLKNMDSKWKFRFNPKKISKVSIDHSSSTYHKALKYLDTLCELIILFDVQQCCVSVIF